MIKYQPVALESDTGDSSIIGGLVAQRHGIVDFDGDGVLDELVHPNSVDSSHWFVWLGDGTGGFGPRRYTFPTRPAPRNNISGIGTTFSQWAKSSEGLFDINADGLPEHWLTSNVFGDLNANLAFHDGTKHRLIGSPSGPTGELTTPQSPTVGVKPGNDNKAVVTSTQGQQILGGEATATNRVIDVDHDGRIDVVQYLAGATRPTVYFNVGGQFNAPGVEYPGGSIPGFGDFTGFLRRIRAIDENPVLSWELWGDLMDLDGDGLAEAAYFGANGFVRAQPLPGAPPRLLKAIHNGRGAHTTIGYASMHDKTAVEQHPELLWSSFGQPKASPQTQWVVRSLSVVDDPAATTSTTSYVYKNPRHGIVDDDRRFSFRGFEEVTTTAPSGAKTIQHYDYFTDRSGRLDKTVVVPCRGADRSPLDRQDHVATVPALRRGDQDLSRDDGRALHLRERSDRGDVHGTHRPRLHQDDLDHDRAREHDPDGPACAALAGDRFAPSIRYGRSRR